jgi:hypothetical protein
MAVVDTQLCTPVILTMTDASAWKEHKSKDCEAGVTWRKLASAS